MVLKHDASFGYVKKLRAFCTARRCTMREYRCAVSSGLTTGVHLQPSFPNGMLVLAVHSLGADRYYPFAELFMQLLAAGCSIFSIDLDGHGRGNSTRLAFPAVLDTLPAVLRFALGREGLCARQVVLLGHSLGGSVCLTQASNADLAGIIAVSAPHSVNTNTRGISEAISLLRPSLWRQLRLCSPYELAPAFGRFKRDLFPCRTDGAGPTYLHDIASLLEQIDVLRRCREAVVPCLQIHGTSDSVVPFDQAREICDAYGAEHRLVPLQGATHLTALFERETTASILSWLAGLPVGQRLSISVKRDPPGRRASRVHTRLPLLAAYPRLGRRLPMVRLGDFPTPVRRLEALETRLGVGRLYVKQDGLSGRPYGGNKVRKLEVLLGEAARRGARAVMTFGYAGSNHATATAVYAHRLGMRGISMLLPQAPAPYVARNLRVSRNHGAEIHEYHGVVAAALGALCRTLTLALTRRQVPFVIPAGGSCPAGTVGYVNAAFELRDQIDAGVVPAPDLIYVAMGTMGTAVGLAVGLRAAGIHAKVVGVRVTEQGLSSLDKAQALARRTCRFLRTRDPSFPQINLSAGDLTVRGDLFEPGYAMRRDDVSRAMAMAAEIGNLRLEGTYSGRACAALVSDAEKGDLKDKTVLFWDTHNAHAIDFPRIAGLRQRMHPDIELRRDPALRTHNDRREIPALEEVALR